MRLPPDVLAVGSLSSPSIGIAKSRFQTGDWSSLIGIITAICGNVLISVALNTQRYAHIKLNQQYQERRRLLRKAQGRANEERGYGTESGATSPSRRKERRTNGVERYTDEEATEDQPLLSESRHSDVTDDAELGSEEGLTREEENVAQKSYLRSPYWWTGIVLMTIGEAGNFLAYGFAPASIVSPLGVVALISNCIIAPIFLKERFRSRDALGVLIAVGGAVTVVLSASDSNPKLGPKEIWRLIGTWEFETYLGLTVGAILVLMWASTKYGEKSIFIDIGLVGLFGGYTALSTKGVASMLSYTLFKALTFPITYLLVAVLVSTAIMQIKYVNRALQRFDSTQVIPTQFVMFTLSVILGSAVLYRDFEKETGEAAGKFIGGCALTFLGVWLITSGRKKDDDDEEVLEEDEEAIRLASEGLYYDDPEQNRPKAQRRSTAPLAHAVPINGHRPATANLSPPNLPGAHDLRSTPQITRTRTAQSTSFIDSDGSEPTSFAEPSPLSGKAWISPEEQTTTARKTVQKLLKPLDNYLPRQHNDQRMPRTLKSTTSEPILPMEATYHVERPQTPPNATETDQPIVQTPGDENRLARRSIVDLFPGPLTATLSSPLSAIVADSLRRGVDPRSLKPKRRRKLPGLPTSPQPQRNHSEAEVTFQQSDDATSSSLPGQRPALDPKRSRLRSLSNTFGDLFRSSKKARTESDGDAEQGRSGHESSERDS